MPALTERLIILNLPHPRGMTHELAHNPKQQEQSTYARNFQQEGAHKQLTPEALSAWVKDPVAREHYSEAFQRLDFEAMLHADVAPGKGGVAGKNMKKYEKI